MVDLAPRARVQLRASAAAKTALGALLFVWAAQFIHAAMERAR